MHGQISNGQNKRPNRFKIHLCTTLAWQEKVGEHHTLFPLPFFAVIKLLFAVWSAKQCKCKISRIGSRFSLIVVWSTVHCPTSNLSAPASTANYRPPCWSPTSLCWTFPANEPCKTQALDSCPGGRHIAILGHMCHSTLSIDIKCQT